MNANLVKQTVDRMQDVETQSEATIVNAHLACITIQSKHVKVSFNLHGANFMMRYLKGTKRQSEDMKCIFEQ